MAKIVRLFLSAVFFTLAATHLFLLSTYSARAENRIEELQRKIHVLHQGIEKTEMRLQQSKRALEWREDAFRRLTKGGFQILEPNPTRNLGDVWDFLKEYPERESGSYIHHNIYKLWEEYLGEFTRYKAARGEEIYTFRELGRYIKPREEKYLRQLKNGIQYNEKVLPKYKRLIKKLYAELHKLQDAKKKTSHVAPDDGKHTLFDYCNIAADSNFRRICYEEWRVACGFIMTHPQNRSIIEEQNISRCKDVLRPGGPRIAGRIWDFCALTKHPVSRHHCYDHPTPSILASICTAIAVAANRRECIKRAANVPSNRPAPKKSAKTDPEDSSKAKLPATPSADKNTEITTTSVRNPDGTRTVTRKDSEGNILSREKVR